MPNPNAIVGLVQRINPTVDRPGVEMLRRSPDGFTLEFEGDQAARLYPGERAAGWLEVLEELRKLRTPAYVEIDPNTRGIMRLLIPVVSTIAAIETIAFDIIVELANSHAVHRLKRGTADFDEMLTTLRDAQAKRGTVIVTDDDEHTIIDVRPSPIARSPGTPKLPAPRVLSKWFKRLRWWFCDLLYCFCRCVSPTRAQALFDLVSAQSCNPVTVPPPCIPFLYPDDGCWGRAHEMCRLMIAAGAHPDKVWIYHSPSVWLHVNTRNNPNCYVEWGWHVAPTLCVRKGIFGPFEKEVIDPALFSMPVSKTTWKSVQGDAAASLVDTTADVFWRGANGSQTYDPTYSQSNSVLNTYRQSLKLRSMGPSGPPPYANCP